MGAAFLDEVADYADSLADDVDLPSDERDRFLRWAIEFKDDSSRKVFGVANQTADKDITDEFDACTCGRVTWAPVLAEYVYFDFDNDERNIPLLEICPSVVAHDGEHEDVDEGEIRCSRMYTEGAPGGQLPKDYAEDPLAHC